MTSSVVFRVPHYPKDLEHIKRATEMIKEPLAVIKRGKDLLGREKMTHRRLCVCRTQSGEEERHALFLTTQFQQNQIFP